MAGNYPDAPGPRIAFDRDGTVGLTADSAWSAISSTLSSASLLALNDETFGNVVTGGGVCLIFPHLMDLAALGFRFSETGTGSAPSVSQTFTTANTTNGIDGTWTARGAVSNQAATKAAIRSPQSLIVGGVKGVRWYQAGGGATITYQQIHLYGTPSAGANPDRIRMWHPTLDEPLDDNTAADGAYLDWGDVVRGTTQDRTFRIKNNSATLTANSIVLSPQVPTDTSPTVASQMTLSDGGAFTGSLNIGNLAPGSISPVITLRRTIALNAVLSLWTGRININPGSWT